MPQNEEPEVMELPCGCKVEIAKAIVLCKEHTCQACAKQRTAITLYAPCGTTLLHVCQRCERLLKTIGWKTSKEKWPPITDIS